MRYKKYLVDYYEEYFRKDPKFSGYHEPLNKEGQMSYAHKVYEENNLQKYSSGLEIVDELSRTAFYIHRKSLTRDPYEVLEFQLFHHSFIKEGLKFKVFDFGGVKYEKNFFGFSIKKTTDKPDSFDEMGTSAMIDLYGLGTTMLYKQWAEQVEEDQSKIEYLNMENYDQ